MDYRSDIRTTCFTFTENCTKKYKRKDDRNSSIGPYRAAHVANLYMLFEGLWVTSVTYEVVILRSLTVMYLIRARKLVEHGKN